MKNTRSLILQANFDAIQKSGFHQLRPDKEVEKLGISKGAFYHYFQSKNHLLETIIEELVIPNYLRPWKKLEKIKPNPISELQKTLQMQVDNLSITDVKNGCVTNKLIHEICQDYPQLKEKLKICSQEIVNIIATNIKEAIEQKLIKPLIDADDLAYLILSAYNGSKSISKVEDSINPHKKAVKSCILILENLRIT